MSRADVTSLLVWLLLLTGGCDQPERVELFNFGRNWVYDTYGPERYQADVDRRMARAYLLFKAENYAEAVPCFEQVYQSSRGAEAATVNGVIFTKIGRLQDAEAVLRSAVAADQRFMWPRVTLCWNLCEQEKFGEAEAVALKMTQDFSDSVASDVLHQVRDRRGTAWAWMVFRRTLAVLVLSGIAFLVIWRVWLKEQLRRASLRMELTAITREECSKVAGVRAQLSNVGALSQTAAAFENTLRDAELNAHAAVYNSINAALTTYKRAVAELNGLDLDAAEKERRRIELEDGLRELVKELAIRMKTTVQL